MRATRQGAGEELGAHAESIEQRREPCVVLPREDLGRRHQGALPARAHGARKSDRRHGGLAAADVPLQEPAHRPLDADVAEHLVDGGRLVGRQREWQGADDLRPHRLVDSDPRRAESLARLTGLGQGQLQREQLVEREPVECLGDVGRLLREVRRAQRVVERPEVPLAPCR